ncbi:MAG: PKD domain-containing protein [Deltaproteobacteria bacterium]|nr:MAG: PKD domain-containing protein [Deltaproteobacteria bacterium]
MNQHIWRKWGTLAFLTIWVWGGVLLFPGMGFALRELPGDSQISGAVRDQDGASMAAGDGTILVVWADERAITGNRIEEETSVDIYGVRIGPSGEVLDPIPLPIRVAPAAQSSPKVSWNGTNWLVVYVTQRLSGTGFYYEAGLEAVRVAPDGTPLDAQPIELHGMKAISAASWAVASDGVNWVVVAEGSGANGDLIGIRIAPDGTVLDPPIRTLVPATYYLRSHLRLAYAQGVFLLTFNDDTVNGAFRTSAIRFDRTLERLDEQPRTFLDQPIADLATNGSSFYVVWNEQLPDFSTAVTGSRVGREGFMLDRGGVNISRNHPSDGGGPIEVTWDGSQWKVTWSSDSTLQVARIDEEGRLRDPGGISIPGPDVGSTEGRGDGSIEVLWSTLSYGQADIQSARISPEMVAEETKDLSTGAPSQQDLDIAASEAGFLFAYRSESATECAIMIHAVDRSGVPLSDHPRELDRAAGPNLLGAPAVAWNGNVYMVTWNTPSGIVAQRIASDGSPIDTQPFLVLAEGFGGVDIAALGDLFLVTARAQGYSEHIVLPVAIRIDGATGEILDEAPIETGRIFASNVRVVTLAGRWLLVWQDNVSHDDPLAYTYATFIDAGGEVTEPFEVHGAYSTAGGNGRFSIGAASNDEVAIVVQSQELSSGVETDLLARLVAPDGTVSGMIHLTPWSGNQFHPEVAWDGTHFVVVWQDEKNRLAPHSLDQLDARSDIFVMRIAPSGDVLDSQGRIFSTFEGAETDPTIAARGGVSLIGASRLIPAYASYRIVYETFDASVNLWPVPLLSATPESGDFPLEVRFIGSRSFDPDGGGVTPQWDFGDGDTSTQADPLHRFERAGDFLVTLTLTDADGDQASQGMRIRVTAPNIPPVAKGSASVTSGPAPLQVVFTASGSYDPDGEIGNISWETSDGSTTWGSPAYYTFYEPGTYTVTLTVFDSRGAEASDTFTIEVGSPNLAPLAVASAEPTTGSVPLTVVFSSAGSEDPDGRIESYLWNFGDGGRSSDPNPTHIYRDPGTYQVTLTVTDTFGATGEDELTITVLPPASQRLVVASISLRAWDVAGFMVVTAHLEIVDGRGRAVPNVLATLRWRFPDGEERSVTALSKARGNLRLLTAGPRGTYTLEVEDLFKQGYTFDAEGSERSASISP